MDYKEEYQKALERAKQGLPIDEVFPELKESEDERIRKELIEAIEKARVFDIDKEVADRWIAYLERQKEQKTNPYSGTGFDYNGHHWGMCARDGGVEIIVDEKIRDRVSFESENIKWSNSDAKEMFIKALERAVEQTKKGYELTDCDKHSWWEDFKAYSKIKPAEWSEEDERMLEPIISDLRELCNCETDEELISDYEDRIAWLESLRPSWKPSEEQVYSLGTVVKGYDNCTVGSVGYNLKELYKDLKKL